jgi:hypothetical protein
MISRICACIGTDDMATTFASVAVVGGVFRMAFIGNGSTCYVRS